MKISEQFLQEKGLIKEKYGVQAFASLESLPDLLEEYLEYYKQHSVNVLVSSLLPSDGDIEKLALEMEARYNECHFWKRGKIYADGLRIGAKWIREKARGNLADVNF